MLRQALEEAVEDYALLRRRSQREVSALRAEVAALRGEGPVVVAGGVGVVGRAPSSSLPESRSASPLRGGGGGGRRGEDGASWQRRAAELEVRVCINVSRRLRFHLRYSLTLHRLHIYTRTGGPEPGAAPGAASPAGAQARDGRAPPPPRDGAVGQPHPAQPGPRAAAAAGRGGDRHGEPKAAAARRPRAGAGGAAGPLGLSCARWCQQQHQQPAATAFGGNGGLAGEGGCCQRRAPPPAPFAWRALCGGQDDGGVPCPVRHAPATGGGRAAAAAARSEGVLLPEQRRRMGAG